MWDKQYDYLRLVCRYDPQAGHWLWQIFKVKNQLTQNDLLYTGFAESYTSGLSELMNWATKLPTCIPLDGHDVHTLKHRLDQAKLSYEADYELLMYWSYNTPLFGLNTFPPGKSGSALNYNHGDSEPGEESELDLISLIPTF